MTPALYAHMNKKKDYDVVDILSFTKSGSIICDISGNVSYLICQEF
jgi:hypothetical protein